MACLTTCLNGSKLPKVMNIVGKNVKIERRLVLKAAAAAAATALPMPMIARAQESGPVKIGVIIGLTGSAAVAGNDSSAAMKLAAEEVNKAGGVLGRHI